MLMEEVEEEVLPITQINNNILLMEVVVVVKAMETTTRK